MKRLSILFLLTSSLGFSQTTLAPGDLVITSLIADGNDRFQFIPLVDLELGTVIYFTESGWNATLAAWRNDDLTEGVIKYTAPSAITTGTVITVEEDAVTDNLFLKPTDGSIVFTDYGNNWALSSSGDQIIAFQGTPPVAWVANTDTNPFPNPTFLFIVSNDSNLWYDAATTNSSAIPPGLTNGATAITLGKSAAIDDEWDNIYFDAVKHPLDGLNKSEIIALVGNAANWIGDDAVVDGTTFWQINSFTLGLNQLTNSELSIYPNPANNGLVNIKSQLSSVKNITLLDMLGRSVLQTKLNSDVLDVRAIKSGMYLLQVSIGNRSSTSKLMIK
jgi:hypothetical protein